MVASGFGEVVVFNSQLHLVDPPTVDDDIGDGNTVNWLIIGIACGVVILVTLFGVCCCCRKKYQVEVDLPIEKSEEKEIARRQKMADSFHIIDLE